MRLIALNRYLVSGKLVYHGPRYIVSRENAFDSFEQVPGEWKACVSWL